MLKFKKIFTIALGFPLLFAFQNCGQMKASSSEQSSVSLNTTGSSSCVFNGQTIASGNTSPGFSVSSVPFGQSCDQAKISVTCTNGNLTPVTASATCASLPGASCTFNGRSIASGENVQAFQAASVPSGSTCASQTRTCINGTLDGTYGFAACAVNAPLNCSFNGNVILNGATTQGYPSATVPFGQTCKLETITCSNAVLNPATDVATCTVQPGAACNFNGQKIPSGGTVQGFPSATVPFGQTCKAETITCTNGVLSPANDVAFCSVQPPQTDFYVANGGSDSNAGTISQPLVSLARARDLAAQASQNAFVPVHVYLRGGTYTQIDPLIFQSGHSGSSTSPIQFLGYNGETVVVSGAVSVSGQTDCNWSLNTIQSISGPYPYVMRCVLQGNAKTQLAQKIAKIKSSQNGGAFAITEMFVGGQRKIRSRHPNQDAPLDVHYLDSVSTECPNRCPYILGPNSNWGILPTNLVTGATEIVFSKLWTQPRALLTALDNNGVRNGISAAGLNPQSAVYAGSGVFNEVGHLENNASFLDSAGEWYFDESSLSFDYVPAAGEDVTKEVFSFPVNNNLIQLQGVSPTSTVHDLQFKNINFEYSSWSYKNSAGTSAYYAFEQAACGLGGLIDGNFVRNIRIYNNIFRHYGEYAISLGGSRNGICSNTDGMAENIGINANNFDDGGGGAIRIDSKGSSSGYVKVSANKINYVGLVFADAVGIGVLSSPNVLVANNEVFHTTYTGISTGWQCRNTAKEQMIIEANNVQDVMTRLSDGGAIYSHGSQGFVIGNYITTVGENRATDAKPFPSLYFQGIYLDDNGYYWNVSNTNSFGSLNARKIFYKSTTDTIPIEFSPISTYTEMIWKCPISNDGTSIDIAPPAIQRTSCAVTVGDCPNKPDLAGQTTNDTYEDADVDQVRCMARAQDYFDYCSSTSPVTAAFMKNAVVLQSRTSN